MSNRSFSTKVLGALLFSLAVLNLFSRHATEYTFIALLFGLMCHKITTERSLKGLFPSMGADIFYLAWFVVLPISHLVNQNFNHHEISEWGEYRWMLGIYFVVSVLLMTGLSKRVFQWFLLATTASCIYFTIDFILNPMFPGYIGYPNRMVGMLFSPTDFGHTMIFLFLLCITFLMLSKPKQSPISYWILVFATFATGANIFFSQTRAVFVAAVICILGLAFYISKRLMTALCISGVLLVLAFYYVDFMGFRERVDYSLGPHQTYESARVMLWRGHIEMIKEHFTFGVGYHHNQFLLRPYYDRLGFPPGVQEAHAHNQYINIFAGTGIFGILWYLGIMGFFIKTNITNIKSYAKNTFEYQLSVATLMMLLGFLISGITDTNFELMNPKYYLLLTWSIIVYQKKMRPSITQQTHLL